MGVSVLRLHTGVSQTQEQNSKNEKGFRFWTIESNGIVWDENLAAYKISSVGTRAEAT